MYKKIIFIVALILTTACVISACTNNTKINSKDVTNLITVVVTYKEVATNSDFEKYHNVYSPETNIELKKDHYYLIKVVCTVSNKSSKNLSGLDFITYNDQYLMYETGAIDIEPTDPIEPNSCESFDAYIYVDESLDNEVKITNELSNTFFNFQAYLYDDSPLYSTQISFQGKFDY